MQEELEKAQLAFDCGRTNEALMILKPMADKNIPEAFSLLGNLYHLSENLDFLDGAKAEKYYKKAVDLGQGISAHNLGTLYATGIPNFSPNAALSKEYYKMAKKMGAQFADDSFYD